MTGEPAAGASAPSSVPSAESSPAPGRPPQRVRVTAARSVPASAAPYTVSRELDEQTEVGEVFIGSLIRSQLRLALVVGGGFMVILLGVPVLLAFLPVISGLTLLTVPLPWFLLGVGVYPLVIVCGVLYVRSAARNEQRFLDLVDDA
ncbi:hypothetical protein QMA10_06600 [Arthrobacter sp. APC 3897]|uniref:hypothetical protein n=1 Tax=Arthrobacter sp. APC 3897 TaxID=3035204 RepID=UPI0025B5F92F|nr:hypothetical protein [Arthrobacter sp. APC 3897]MDN3481590.1 hypothetical protein [Arthrobacter sp. APC 3897]